MKKIGVGWVLFIETVVIILGMLCTVLMSSGNLNQIYLLFDFPTLLLIAFLSVPNLIVSGLWKDFVKAFFVSNKKYSVAQLKRCFEAVATMQRLILLSGFFVAFISLVTLLVNLENLQMLGPNLAVLSLAGFYVVIIEFLLQPVRSNVQITLIHEMEIDNEEG